MNPAFLEDAMGNPIFSNTPHTVYLSFTSSPDGGTSGASSGLSSMPADYVPAALTVNGVEIGSTPTPVSITGGLFYAFYRPVLGTFASGQTFTDTLTVSGPTSGGQPSTQNASYTPQPAAAQTAVDPAKWTVKVYTMGSGYPNDPPIPTSTVDLGDYYNVYVTTKDPAYIPGPSPAIPRRYLLAAS